MAHTLTTVKRISELEALIFEARNDYYNGTATTVSDEVYDAWVDELSQIKSDSPAVTSIGAAPVSEWLKVSHTIPMGSLSKVNTGEELLSWVTGVGAKLDPLIVTEKLDGISIAVTYDRGVFKQAATRGDGTTGEDISVNVAKMQGVPSRLPKGFTGVLRGEIVLTKSAHAEHFSDYANTRNAASGISKRYDGKGCDHLTIYFYQVADGQDFATEGEQFAWLTEMGLKVPNWYVTAMATTGVRTPHDHWLEYQQSKRDALDYEIDGLVVRINDLTKQIALGESDNRPKGAVAFKFAPMTRESVLQRIDWQVGGSGRITPVGVFNPVQLVGATITNASLYNVSYINQLGLDVGATVVITRANDVIPRVSAVRKGTGTVARPPSVCPVCGASTRTEGEYLLCSDSAGCPAQALGRVKRWVDTLDVKEWGDTLLEKLVETGLVKDIPDLYRITEDQLANVDRMGKKSAAKCLSNLWAKNTLALEDLLGSLSIPMCGPTMIKIAMDGGYDTLSKLKSASVQQLSAVEGFGPAKAQALWVWLRDNGSVVDRLQLLGVKIQEKVHGNLTGMSFCFTGASSRPRNELERLVKEAGGEVKTSVGKKLTYLVLADANSTSSKAQAARKNGTKCISEGDFMQLVSRGGA